MRLADQRLDIATMTTAFNRQTSQRPPRDQSHMELSYKFRGITGKSQSTSNESPRSGVQNVFYLGADALDIRHKSTRVNWKPIALGKRVMVQILREWCQSQVIDPINARIPTFGELRWNVSQSEFIPFFKHAFCWLSTDQRLHAPSFATTLKMI